MKVYLIYLKKDKALYGFTATKEYFYRFLEQRNPKCFYTKTMKMTDTEFSHFSYTNKSTQLIEDVLSNKESTVQMIVTGFEADHLEVELDNIDRYVEEIERIFRKYPLRKKYQRAIDHLTTIDDGKGNLLIDTLSLFVDLHIETFIT